jgi:hypothetical protein
MQINARNPNSLSNGLRISSLIRNEMLLNSEGATSGSRSPTSSKTKTEVSQQNDQRQTKPTKFTCNDTLQKRYLYRMSHVTRNSHTSMRRLRSALWLTNFPVVLSLLLRHAVVVGFTLSGTTCINRICTLTKKRFAHWNTKIGLFLRGTNFTFYSS